MFGRLIDFWDNHVESIAAVLIVFLVWLAMANSAYAGPAFFPGQEPFSSSSPQKPVLDGKTPVTDPDILRQIEKYRPHSTSEWHRFDKLHEAAIAAADRLIKCSHYYECSAVIVLDPKGKYTVGPAHTNYNSDNVSVTFSSVPADWERVAAVHSHPCIPRHAGNLFSPPDMMGAFVTRTTFYMVDLCTGAVHEFIPGVTKPDDVQTADGLWLTEGKIIGYTLPVTENLEANEGI